MSEKYQPSRDEISRAEGMMNQKQEKMSGERDEHFDQIENPELIKECHLRLFQSGNFDIIKGSIKGHGVELRRMGGNGPCSGEIEGSSLSEVDAKKLYEKYLGVAELQTLDAKQSEDLQTDAGKASMLAAELLK